MPDDLSSALRELADSAACPPPTTGAEVRRRAVARRRRRNSAYAGGGVAVVAALAFGLTTAFGGPEPRLDPAPPPAASLTAPTAGPASPAVPTPSASPSTEPSPTAPTLAGPTPTAPATGGPSATAPATPPATIAACGVGDLAFSATNQDEAGKPVRHLLLTVTNTGSAKCGLQGYPYLKFPHARAPIAVIEDSKDAPVTLAPGEKAYAALLASGGRMDTYDTDTLPLGLQPGGPANVALPGQVSFDDGARVTYWIPASGLALRFIGSR
ncbi:DUF4232 domain-containing protein [Streptomyces sp. W1SF4]|uniref:DUF4232 domain-containing protein n=1 Tax=Streptomyces sp. W1SF4 TaxID=2305220 RepID=UPI0013DF5373|nr:DUF4232 domain-containing protein [Streptomyces sp. W1SF4]